MVYSKGIPVRWSSLVFVVVLVQGACDPSPGVGIGGDEHASGPVAGATVMPDLASSEGLVAASQPFLPTPMFLHAEVPVSVAPEVQSPSNSVAGLARMHLLTANLELMDRVASLEPGERITINPFHDVQWIGTPRGAPRNHGEAQLVEIAIEGHPLAFAAMSFGPDGALLEVDDPDLPFLYQVVRNGGEDSPYVAREVQRRGRDVLPDGPVMIPPEDPNIALHDQPPRVEDTNPATFGSGQQKLIQGGHRKVIHPG